MTAPNRDHSKSVRIHVHLRGADVALMPSMGPAEIWYFIAHSDLPPENELPTWCVRVTPLSAVRRIFATRAHTIEIPEPLWARFLPTGLTLMVAARIARLTSGRPVRTVFYALENNEPDRALFGDSPVPAPLRRTFVRILGLVESFLVDRVAFGTPAAQRSYESMGTLQIKESLVITELPARPTSAQDDQPGNHNNGQALFVGGLERRKGVRPLMQAWADVERIRPDARITIIGSGPLADEVARWVDAKPSTRRYLGQVPHAELADHYRSADVLIAPSVRDGRWREQVGLQLRESLRQGLTLVVTNETGLADWLAQNGHHVLSLENLTDSLPKAILSALANPIPRETVRSSLPREDGRVAADKWLHG